VGRNMAARIAKRPYIAAADPPHPLEWYCKKNRGVSRWYLMALLSAQPGLEHAVPHFAADEEYFKLLGRERPDGLARPARPHRQRGVSAAGGGRRRKKRRFLGPPEDWEDSQLDNGSVDSAHREAS